MALARLTIVSCGKRSEIEFEMVDGSSVRGGVDAKVTFVNLIGVEQSFRALDDVYVELVLTPAAPSTLVLDVAEVDFWIEGESMPVSLEAFTAFRAAFDYRLGFRLAG